MFNQPETANAMSIAMWDGMAEALGLFEAGRRHPLRRAGRRGRQGLRVRARHQPVRGQPLGRRCAAPVQHQDQPRPPQAGRVPKPVIAKIQGFCMGGGLGIAMSCDMRIAGEGSEFGIPAAKLGIAYGFDMVSNLVALVGPAHAHFILMTGGRLPAEEAQRMGLINRLVPESALDAEVDAITATIAGTRRSRCWPTSARCARCWPTPPRATWRRSPRRRMPASTAPTTAKGRRAFMEKRRPAFTGA
jgi:enoyl-CoA hydratase/carnithine racemase